MKKFFLIASALLVLGSCKKEWDKPPVEDLPVGSVISIKELKNMYVNQDVKFTEDYSVYAVVTADERNGNLYKNVYVQDNSGAILLRLVNSGGLYQGDSIRIYLKGTRLTKYNNMMQLDSVDVNKHIVKQGVGKYVAPLVINNLSLLHDSLQSYLIKLENVQFMQAEIGKTWADAANKTTQNRMLEDCNGNTLIVRTSGYANFASQPLPQGNGSMIGILGIYNSDKQFYVRDISEVQMNQPRCNGNSPGTCQPVDSLIQDFNSFPDNTDISIQCYTNKATSGTRLWRTKLFSGNTYIQTNAYNSTDASNEVWFITPPIQATPNIKMEFKSAQAYWTHAGFKVFISTNYNGTDPASATWTEISSSFTLPTSSTSNYQWVNSGVVNLAGFLPMGYNGAFYIAFRYNGSSANGQTGTFCIDDIKIYN